ncbi:hypothetical protein CMI42_03325 [Candidatus Pacearchaeota archaeon]|nr:hypothetical protein [Candidatus Pacearchaeota archaeon]
MKILEGPGFKIVRQRGGRVSLRHIDGRSTTVPNHSGERLDRSLLNKILKKDIKISREKFQGLL